jgi:hypothetical protein
MVAVLPDFELPPEDEEELAESWFEWRASGYCTFPYAIPPGIGHASTTVIPELEIGAPGKGFDGALYLEAPSKRARDLWLKAIRAEPTREGIRITATNELGASMLDAASIPSGATIVGEGSDVLGFGLRVDRALSNGELIMVVLEHERRRLHRYIVPVNPSPEEDAWTCLNCE